MVQSIFKTARVGFNVASKCSVTVVIWSLAGWIILFQVYTFLFPPVSQVRLPRSDEQLRTVAVYRGREDDRGEKVVEFPTLGDPTLGRLEVSDRGRARDREEYLLQEIARKEQEASRRAFFFPDKSIAINPMKTGEKDMQYFYPGREWRDTTGRPIQAHGGGILHVKESGMFYWYGENKDGRTYRVTRRSAARVDVLGISCYSSKDLWTWKNEGIVLPAEKMNKTHDLHVSNVVERPKVVYNDKTKQFVMWMHVDSGNYSKASVGVAVSSVPIGPFKYLGSMRPHGHDSRDMTIFKDDDAKVYIIYSSKENSELHVGVLTEDYTDLRRVMKRILVGQHREAPTVFKHKGIYYMVTSGCTGWQPNPAQVHASVSMFGPWEAIGDPTASSISREYSATTFYSQGTFVVPLPGLPDTFLFMADRWRPTDLRDSRYVWLPLTLDGPADEPLEDEFDFPIWQRVTIHWYRKWKLPEGWDSTPAAALIS